MRKINNEMEGPRRNPIGILAIFLLVLLASLTTAFSSWAATPKIAAGGLHTVALKSDGTLWAWGSNDKGQLGDGSTTDSLLPKQIGTDRNWTSVAAGAQHTVALKSDGTLWAWGYNIIGQLGDGSTTDSHSPKQIGTDNTWASVAALFDYNVALKSDGTLWAWGNNIDGQLGDGSTTNSLLPKQIGTDNTWAAIAAGWNHTVALKSAGTLWAWGSNLVGQLGDGSTTNSLLPKQIGTDNTWAAIAAGAQHTVALKSNGTLWAWGYNIYGQLGDNSTTESHSPKQIDIYNNWTSIDAGSQHTVALRSDGTLWAWGWNFRGELGDGSTTNSLLPEQIGTDYNWASVAAGGEHTVALKSDGILWAWGDNGNGQLGDDTTTERDSPVQITTVGASTILVSAGSIHSMAVNSDGTLWGWGWNDTGALGDGTWDRKISPFQIGTDTKWTAIATGGGDGFTIGLKADGTLWTWGDNSYGQLGTGDWTSRTRPTRIGTETDWKAISAGNGHTVALKSNGTLWGWGMNIYNQLADGTQTNKNAPIQIGSDSDWVKIAAGFNNTVALKSNGTIYSWGNDYPSPTQIGTGATWKAIASGGSNVVLKSDGTVWFWYGTGTPAQIAGLGDIVAISQRAALKSDGSLWAWGANNYGQLGDGTTNYGSSPVRIGTDTNWIGISAGYNDTLALKSDGSVWAWGWNSYGQLGDGTTNDTNFPIPIGSDAWYGTGAGAYFSLGLKSPGGGARPLWNWGSIPGIPLLNAPTQVGSDTDWASIGAGYYHAMGIKGSPSATLWSWGINQYGQLGTGDTTGHNTPTQVGTDTYWMTATGGFTHTVALKSNGSLWVWGGNYYGQLGFNYPANTSSPSQLGSGAWLDIAAGFYHTVAIKSDRTLWAWGWNVRGQLGTGDTTDYHTPTQVGSDTDWATVVAGYGHTVALKTNGTLWAWGLNHVGQLGDGSYTQRNAPVQIGTDSDWLAISASSGSHQTIALKTNGSLWAWGWNSYGQLGDGTNVGKNIPTRIGTDLWSEIAAGRNFTLARKTTDNSLWAWGHNGFGQLGNGVLSTDKNLPTGPLAFPPAAPVLASPSNGVTGIGLDVALTWEPTERATTYQLQVSTSSTFGTTILDQSGIAATTHTMPGLIPNTSYYWRVNATNGGATSVWSAVWSFTTASVPSVPPLGSPPSGTTGVFSTNLTWYPSTGATSYGLQIATNGSFGPGTLVGNFSGITSTSYLFNGRPNTTYYWRVNATGVGGTSNWSSPASSFTTTNIQIAAGTSHTVALKSNGPLWAWGVNDVGQLGDGTNTNRTTPVPVSGGATNWVSVSAGYSHTVALKPDGTLWAWGYNGSGQLGDGTTTIIRNTPVPVSGGATNWVSVSAGSTHTVALKSDGTLWAWGDNHFGELGNGTITDSNTPVQVFGGATNWVSVSAGYYSTLALKSDGTLWAWGYNGSGQLGDGTALNRNIPVQVLGGGANWVSVSAGYYFTVALKSDGTLWAWGDNSSGQFGNGNTPNSNIPVQGSGGGTNWVSVSPGWSYTVALKSDGTLWAWGDDTYGELGEGTNTSSKIPVQVLGGTNWASVSAGGNHTVAVKSDGTLWAWGYNNFGQLGDGTQADKNYPFAIKCPLIVTMSGTGTGTVTSQPGTINCPTACSYIFDEMTPVTLHATPGAGSIFTGWSGGCSGTGDCTLTMNGPQSVTASFHTGSLYDDFPGPLINKSKWIDGEFVREIDPVSQKLLLKQASSNPIQFTGYPASEYNNLNFISPNSIYSIQADVAVADFSTNNNAHLRARVAGRWYNDGTSTDGMVGDIYGEVSLRVETSGLRAQWAISRFTNQDGTTWQTLKWGWFTTPIALGVSYNLYIKYDPSVNQFTFTVGTETVTFGPGGLPSWGDVPHSPWKAPGTRVEISDSTSSGYISATFDNVVARDGSGTIFVIDDFSSPTIDPTKWTSYEFVREISSEGQHRSKLLSPSQNTAILHNEFRLVNPWLPAGTGAQAKVTLWDYQNPQGLWERAGISGAFYSDTPAGVGRIGDVQALVYIGGSGAIPVGGWIVTRCGDDDCSPDHQTNPGQGIFPVTIRTGEPHNLYLAWDGSKFNFGFDGMEASFTPNPSTIQGPPKVPYGEGSTRIQPSAGRTQGTIEAKFDDVMLSSIPVNKSRLRSFDLAVFNGNLAGSVIVLPGFRPLVRTVTLSGPSPFSPYSFDLQRDTLNWLSECRYLVGWQKNFGLPSAYGVYALTIEYFDGLIETYTKNLQAAAVSPATNIAVTFDTGGNANLTWTAGSTQAYHVMVRSGDNTTEYYRSDDFTPFSSGLQTFQIPPGSLNCLEKGQSYNWIVRVYDLPPSNYSGGASLYNAAQSSSVSIPYNTALSDQRTSLFRADVRKLLETAQSDFELYFDVRAGSRDRIKQATVTGPKSYEFNLTDDLFNVSTETRSNKGWLHLDPTFTTWGQGNYTLTVTYDDDGDGTIDHTDTVTKYYQNNPNPAGVDSATMTSNIDPNGAITFQWDSAGSNLFYDVRIRSIDGTKEYYTARLTQTSVIFPSLIGLEHCKTYEWYVRTYDTSNLGTANAVAQSAHLLFFYNPFNLPYYALTVTKSAAATGTVTSSPAGINCGPSCSTASDTYVQGVPLTLTATPSAGYVFTGWLGGGCSGTGPCTVTMDAAKNVTAIFATAPPPPQYSLQITKSGSGTGTVTSLEGGINCGPSCNVSFIPGTVITLTAAPNPPYSLTDWSGCDSTNGAQCTVTMNSAKSINATFGVGACTYSISPTSAYFDPSVGSGTISVAASYNACSWIATTANGWITSLTVTFPPGLTTGDGVVSYNVAANTGPTAAPRTGTITIAGQTFTVNQSASVTTPPAAPSGLQLSGQPLALQWNSVSGAAGYKVYYGTSEGAYDTSVNMGNLTSYQIPLLATGVTYFFTVAAVDSNNNVSSFQAPVTLQSYDTDGDGIPDYMDNCPTIYNPDQTDLCNVISATPPSQQTCDSDKDGLCDTQDNCPSLPNNGTKGTCLIGKTACSLSLTCTAFVGDICITTQLDSDGDGYGDPCDTCPDVANANQQKPVWYKDFDNDLYSDGTTVSSCHRPQVCLNNPSLICTPVTTAVPACPSGCTGGWVDNPTTWGGYGFKSSAELRATSGDCDDNSPNVNPGKQEQAGNGIDDDCNPATPDALYEIVFVNMQENNSPVDYFSWLPTDNVTITADIKVRRVSDGYIINPTSITLFASGYETTSYRGKYANDPATGVCSTTRSTTCPTTACPTGESCVDPNPDFEVVNITPPAGSTGTTGNITVKSHDFGGTITFHFDVVTFTDGGPIIRLTNQIVRLPRDVDGDGLADAWEMAKFGNLNYGPSDDPDGDGLTSLDEYRGFMWGRLVPSENVNYGYCSTTTTQICNAYANCPASEVCLPYSYQTQALVPDLDPNSTNGAIRISYFRTNPTRKDLFVKYTGYNGNYPFAIGTAYANQGIDVHAVDYATATAFFNGDRNGERKIDVLLITNDSIHTLNSEDPHLYHRSLRDWTFKTLGVSGYGDNTTYGSSITYRLVLQSYFSDRPYLDGTTLPTGYTVSNAPSPWNAKNGKLDPILNVENVNDDGRKGGGQDKNNNGILDGDYPVSTGSTAAAGPPWVYTKDLSPFNINNQYIQVCTTDNSVICKSGTVCPSGGTCTNDLTRPLLELPVQSDPGNVPPTVKASREQVLKHVNTHEMGHAVGVNVENADSTCVMYRSSNNWVRDNYFSPGAAALIRIHNCCSTD